MMPWWGWIVLGATLLTMEVFLSTDFFLVFFGVSAILLGLIGVFGLSLAAWVQWLLFAALAIAALVVYRRRFRDSLLKADAIVEANFTGSSAVVNETIAAGATGQAELSGTVWTVHNLGEETLQPGDRAVVENVEGLTLFVRRAG